ncbi:MAG TPA: hypothetical protein VFS27_00730 [Blastocatellia bacterium]|jgi:hypothetical protein|nr:hypothetical protein [Blastocatellia bacterium]
MANLVIRTQIRKDSPRGLLSPRDSDRASSLGIVSPRQVREEQAERRRIIRTAQEKYLRECGYDPDQLREAAARLRSEKNLCSHGDDVRNYTSQESAALDLETDAEICGECGKERLRVGLVSPKPLEEMEPDATVREALMTDLLR